MKDGVVVVVAGMLI